MTRRFADRTDAGRQLAAALSKAQLVDPVVLALPRGGVPVAAEVAEALRAPLDVLISRKVGAPRSPETGIGAVAEGGVEVSDPWALEIYGISGEQFRVLAQRELGELERRRALYRGSAEPLQLEGRDVVVVDDGLATGVTAEAAVIAARRLGARQVVLAVPTAATDSARRLQPLVEDLVAVIRSDDFVAVGRWYERFDQTPDETVIEILQEHRATGSE